MRKVTFATGEFYHVFNRGVDKRDIFLGDRDYIRFLSCLREFNTVERIFHLTSAYSVTPSRLDLKTVDANPLVQIISYCLMPNHFHLLLKQVVDGGIAKFMHKLALGYAKYFNLKNERSGALFQGPFKAKHINNDSYLLHLSRYIHLNSLELSMPDWKEFGVKDIGMARKCITEYKWSSYQFFIDQNRTRPFSLETNIVLGQFKDVHEYSNFTLSWTVKDHLFLKQSSLLLA